MNLKKLLLLSASALALSMQAQVVGTDTIKNAEALDFDTYMRQLMGESKVRLDTLPPCFRFRVELKDKVGSPYSLSNPSAYLSEKALARRAKFGIKVDQYDLPVSPTYLAQLREAGVKIFNVSKWNNTATIETPDSAIVEQIKALPFVKNVTFTWSQPKVVSVPVLTEEDRTPKNKLEPYKDIYGGAQHQVEMLSIPQLHQLGYRGEGVTIALIDGGFQNADRVSTVKQENLLSTYNFVRPDSSVYVEGDHGLNALSCIVANEPYALIGTAPEVKFHLLVSEDGLSEQLVEEDNWAAAIEYADSVGADLVSSSLGYYHFDHKAMDHTYREQDGHTSFASRAASLAASRGLVVCISAGNEGDNSWKKIGFPSDAKDILTVGALKADSINTVFSSLGNTADGRIKPDVAAMGQDVRLIDADGTITEADGTSFSCPLMAGAVACLMQAYPTKKPLEIIDAVRRSGHNADFPDNVYGYGLPNMMKAYELLKQAPVATPAKKIIAKKRK